MVGSGWYKDEIQAVAPFKVTRLLMARCIEGRETRVIKVKKKKKMHMNDMARMRVRLLSFTKE